MIEPLGNLVLIKAKKIETVSAGGIVLPKSQTDKEQAVECTGEVVAFGPTACKRWTGCESPRWLELATNDWIERERPEGVFEALCDYWKWNDPDFPPHKQWGVEVGDFIEHLRYNAKDSEFAKQSENGEMENYRFIPDVEILGVIRE